MTLDAAGMVGVRRRVEASAWRRVGAGRVRVGLAAVLAVLTVASCSAAGSHPTAAGTAPATGSASRPASPAPSTSVDPQAEYAARRDCPHPLPGYLTVTPATAPRTVALTFDDGPSPWTPKFVALLTNAHVHGTFFMVASRAVRRPEVVRQVIAAGDRIGNHTWDHPERPYLNQLPAKAVTAEIGNAQAALTELAGTPPCFFRGPAEAHRTANVQTIAHGFGLTITDVTRTAGDAGNPLNATANPTWTEQIVTRLTGAGDHPIVLMHDGHDDNKVNELTALSRIIAWYQQRGYVFTDPLGRPFA